MTSRVENDEYYRAFRELPDVPVQQETKNRILGELMRMEQAMQQRRFRKNGLHHWIGGSLAAVAGVALIMGFAQFNKFMRGDTQGHQALLPASASSTTSNGDTQAKEVVLDYLKGLETRNLNDVMKSCIDVRFMSLAEQKREYETILKTDAISNGTITSMAKASESVYIVKLHAIENDHARDFTCPEIKTQGSWKLIVGEDATTPYK